MEQYLMRVKENKEITDKIYKITLKLKEINRSLAQGRQNKLFSPRPGQFLYIRVSDVTEPLLRRPISIYDYDPDTTQITLVYRVQGEGTKRLSQFKVDDDLDVIGPLGNGFPYDQIATNAHIVLIGGGIGIPPLYYLAKELVERGIKVTTLLGFQSKKDSFLINEFLSLGEVRVSSMDGSIGIRGTVLDLITDRDKWDTFYTCGPMTMMKAIQEKWLNTAIDGYISLEERMGCGIGACYGCVVKVDKKIDKRGYKKVCFDGPVFYFREVIL
ncbi:hypothetical protein BHF71_02645 [Vulcanibacillus modesticaldus]|uniref:Dihydroorotate dehydrogenase B (NAD(+)), electron transfer subunit n=1 Tax=Vulcanibacillus modesticaldus TaxID=337097 RepID=A0A1D2YTR6_9BACI|nr:dihydroorotate dehydrogenase electron transfer subunit [Vulcanibacillus modesticaldus]OEF99100.1 hypothetical protein BHF71_02645 [Vulcanibacillus modesticaldus]